MQLMSCARYVFGFEAQVPHGTYAISLQIEVFENLDIVAIRHLHIETKKLSFPNKIKNTRESEHTAIELLRCSKVFGVNTDVSNRKGHAYHLEASLTSSLVRPQY
jgi:hypothetical protein